MSAAATTLDTDFFSRSVAEVAPDLIGCELRCRGVGGTIVEVERYQEDDPASHSFRGPRGRAAVMFGPPGTVYLYRSYGVHWCLNLVCESSGRGAAVLVRALEPRVGLDEMRARRPGVPDRLLCAGPGRLTAAIGIDGSLNGVSALVDDGPVCLVGRSDAPEIVQGPRIGITKAVERPWRFGLAGSRHLSKPFSRS